MPLPHDPGPHWGEVGIHGLHRQREWDAVVAVSAAGVGGAEHWFVVLADGAIVVEEGPGGVERLIAGIAVPSPYRAHAVRQSGGIWAVAARRIETVELTSDPGGDDIELVWDGTERAVRIDGEPTLAGVPELERLGAARHPSHVVRATRLTSSMWEVLVSPL